MQPIDLHEHMNLALALVAIIGACIGSFITLISHRLPLDEAVVATRSRCPKCSTKLSARDLVPVMSWIMSRGKCRHCHASIGMRYIITEIVSALGAMMIIYHYGELSLVTIAYLGLWWTSVAIIITDLEHYLIMDEYQIALALFGAIFAYATHVEWMNVVIAVACGVFGSIAVKYIFIFITKRDGLGWGDVKLFGVVGIWLIHPIYFAPLLVFAGVLGIVSALIWRAAGKGNVFPFAPAIILSLLLYIFIPDTYATFWQLYGIKMQFLHP